VTLGGAALSEPRADRPAAGYSGADKGYEMGDFVIIASFNVAVTAICCQP